MERLTDIHQILCTSPSLDKIYVDEVYSITIVFVMHAIVFARALTVQLLHDMMQKIKISWMCPLWFAASLSGKVSCKLKYILTSAWLICTASLCRLYWIHVIEFHRNYKQLVIRSQLCDADVCLLQYLNLFRYLTTNCDDSKQLLQGIKLIYN